MHLAQVEEQTIETLVEALEAIEARGVYAFTPADKQLLLTAKEFIARREFMTIAQHSAIVQMAIRYL